MKRVPTEMSSDDVRYDLKIKDGKSNIFSVVKCTDTILAIYNMIMKSNFLFNNFILDKSLYWILMIKSLTTNLRYLVTMIKNS